MCLEGLNLKLQAAAVFFFKFCFWTYGAQLMMLLVKFQFGTSDFRFTKLGHVVWWKTVVDLDRCCVRRCVMTCNSLEIWFCISMHLICKSNLTWFHLSIYLSIYQIYMYVGFTGQANLTANPIPKVCCFLQWKMTRKKNHKAFCSKSEPISSLWLMELSQAIVFQIIDVSNDRVFWFI